MQSLWICLTAKLDHVELHFLAGPLHLPLCSTGSSSSTVKSTHLSFVFYKKNLCNWDEVEYQSRFDLHFPRWLRLFWWVVWTVSLKAFKVAQEIGLWQPFLRLAYCWSSFSYPGDTKLLVHCAKYNFFFSHLCWSSILMMEFILSYFLMYEIVGFFHM